jgi:hypothetical protein
MSCTDRTAKGRQHGAGAAQHGAGAACRSSRGWLAFEDEVDADRAGRGSLAHALAGPVHERRFDEALQALVVKQVPWPISFTSVAEPRRTGRRSSGRFKHSAACQIWQVVPCFGGKTLALYWAY